MKTDRNLFMKKRVLFYEDFCPYCAVYLGFIERFNLLMGPEKRIELVDCTRWQNTGIPDNPLIEKYAKYINGFPTLFFEGHKISGVNSREELEAFMKVMCSNDFKVSVRMPETFDKSCKYINTIFGKRILCK